MTTIVEFLTARLDEDQADAEAAQAADPAPWSADVSDDASTPERYGHGAGLVIAADEVALWDCEGSNALCMTGATARHVARHDPARVLAEVKAKRELIEYWRVCAEQEAKDKCDPEAGAAWAAMCAVLLTLAGAYREHPDYAGDRYEDWTWPDGKAFNVNPT